MRRAGIIAAGEGSRLAAAVPGVPKPLVPVAGRPLAHWVAGGLAAAGAEALVVLVNSRGGALPPSLRAAFPALGFDFLCADTASSFESFRLVCRRLAESAGDFLVSTTDALIPSAEVARFWAECRTARAEAGLALTAHVEDEKPLWAELAADGRVAALGEGARRDAVTCGLYYMTRAAADALPEPSAHARLRDYLGSLAARGRLRGSLLGKTLDVDRPEDLAAAENFLTERAR